MTPTTFLTPKLFVQLIVYQSMLGISGPLILLSKRATKASRLELEPLRNLNAFRHGSNPSIKDIICGLPLPALGPQVGKWDRERFDELVFLELRLGVLVDGLREVDSDMDHAEIGVAETGIWFEVSIISFPQLTSIHE